ncbi:MAG TPA: lasso peptide biosynthesis B2 protein [Bryobacteraceae bacterium]|nr:lasso peptide biosynthesis B2 protein [Bryobacteraceae bacterium]
MRQKLNKILRCPPGRLALIAEICALLALSRFTLTWLPLRVVRRGVWFLAGAGESLPAVRRRSLDEITRSLRSAEAHSPVGSTCLAIAVVGQAVLRRHGCESRLQIGVRRDASGKILAHAWLVQDGKIVVGGPDSVIRNYTAMPDPEHLIA